MSETVLFERRLPLTWSVLSTDEPDISPEQNQLVFALLESSDEVILHNSDKEQTADLQRLESKLNVIMQMLGMLLQGRQPLPPARVVRFSSDSLAWQEASTPEAGSLVAMTLYPEENVPLAMHITVRVQSVSDGWLTADLHGLSEDERAIWSRWVFRQHRRQVAQKRMQAASD